MTNLLIVILAHETHLPAILQKWQKIGLPGATILESAGAYRATSWLQQVGLSAIGDLFSRGENSRTLLAAVDDDSLLEEAISVVEDTVGDLNETHSALYFVIPVTRAGGIVHPAERKAQDPSASDAPDSLRTDSGAITRNTAVSEVDAILKLNPCIVSEDQSLIDTARAMAEHPRSNVACVVNQQQRLTGIIPLKTLADDLFLAVSPDEFLREARSIEAAARIARMTQSNRAKDVMQPPVWVKRDEQVKDAFRKMHQNNLTSIPIVDEKRQVTGVISLLELIALFSRLENNK